MVGSLHLIRRAPGVAHWDSFRLRRERNDLREAVFARPLFLIRLERFPTPVPCANSFGLLALWPGLDALARFRRSPTGRRWRNATRALHVTLRAVHSHGSWEGAQPLAGVSSEARGPVLFVTHATLRVRHVPRFLVANRPVMQAIHGRADHLWDLGFADLADGFGTGTLTLWREASSATAFAYGEGAHQRAVRAQEAGDWFKETWFARMAVTDVEGSWPGFPAKLVSAGPA